MLCLSFMSVLLSRFFTDAAPESRRKGARSHSDCKRIFGAISCVEDFVEKQGPLGHPRIGKDLRWQQLSAAFAFIGRTKIMTETFQSRDIHIFLPCCL